MICMHSLNPCCNGHSYIDPLSKCPSGCDLSGVYRIDLLVYPVIKKLYNKCPLLNIHMEHCYPYILVSEKLLRSSTMHLFPRLLVTDLSLMFSLATVHNITLIYTSGSFFLYKIDSKMYNKLCKGYSLKWDYVIAVVHFQLLTVM